MVSIGSFIHYYLIFNLLKSIGAKSNLLLKSLFSTLKKYNSFIYRIFV